MLFLLAYSQRVDINRSLLTYKDTKGSSRLATSYFETASRATGKSINTRLAQLWMSYYLEPNSQNTVQPAASCFVDSSCIINHQFDDCCCGCSLVS